MNASLPNKNLPNDFYETLFEHLLDEVHVWKLVKNEEGQIVNWTLLNANSVALKNWNKTKAESIGKNASEIFGKEAVDLFIPIVNTIHESQEPQRWEAHFPPTNQILAMESIPFGEVFISTGKDITEKRNAEKDLLWAKEQAEKNEARYKGLIDSLETGVVVHASDTSIISCNVKATELLGLTKDQLMGKEATDEHWRFIYENGKHMPAEEYPVSRVLKTKKSFKSVVLGVYRSKNDLIWLLVNGVPISDKQGKITEIIISFSDITSVRKFEFELEKRNEQLKAVAWHQSHKVRAPLANLMGMAQVLQQEQNVDEAKELITKMKPLFEQLDDIIKETVAKTEKL